MVQQLTSSQANKTKKTGAATEDQIYKVGPYKL